MNPELQQRIEQDITANAIVLFMKGVPEDPQCGFSAQVVEILKKHGRPFAGRDVLADADLRSGIKEFSNWPTIPQLYVQGKFIGGCDIITELDASGELATLLSSAQ